MWWPFTAVCYSLDRGYCCSFQQRACEEALYALQLFLSRPPPADNITLKRSTSVHQGKLDSSETELSTTSSLQGNKEILLFRGRESKSQLPLWPQCALFPKFVYLVKAGSLTLLLHTVYNSQELFVFHSWCKYYIPITWWLLQEQLI